MPELGPQNSSFSNYVDKVKKLRLEKGFLSKEQLAKLAKQYDQEFIGKGSECVVVGFKGTAEPDKVAAFYYKDISTEKAKQIFYLHRFFSTLFPHNFPHFYASSGVDSKNSQNKNVSGTIRNKIKEGILPSHYSFSKVEKICSELGIEIEHLFDFLGQNLMLGADGGEYYIDTLSYSNISEWDINRIVKYMETKKYTKEDIEIARRSIERLKELI